MSFLKECSSGSATSAMLDRVREYSERDQAMFDYVVKSEMLIGPVWPLDLLLPHGLTVSGDACPKLVDCFVKLERLDPDKIPDTFESLNTKSSAPEPKSSETGVEPFKTQLTCRVCGEIYPTLRSLSTHKRKHNKKTYKCHLCPKIFRMKGSLNKHIEKHSQPKKTHVCKVCNKVSRSLYDLTNHERLHSDDKPYACNMCKHRCNSKYNSKYN